MQLQSAPRSVLYWIAKYPRKASSSAAQHHRSPAPQPRHQDHHRAHRLHDSEEQRRRQAQRFRHLGLHHAHRRTLHVGDFPESGEQEQSAQHQRRNPAQPALPAWHVRPDEPRAQLCHTVVHGPYCTPPAHPSGAMTPACLPRPAGRFHQRRTGGRGLPDSPRRVEVRRGQPAPAARPGDPPASTCESGSGKVRLALMTRADLERLREDDAPRSFWP